MVSENRHGPFIAAGEPSPPPQASSGVGPTALGLLIAALLLALIGVCALVFSGPSLPAAYALVLAPVALLFALLLFCHALTQPRRFVSFDP